MKKIILCLMVVLLAFSFAACGQTDKPTDNNGVSSNTSTTDATKPQNKGISIDELLNHAETPISDFICNEDENGRIHIEQYLGHDEIVVLPSTYEGKNIEVITNQIFANNSSVKAIKLSDPIKVIDDYSFALNKNLELIVCGNNLETIGESAFLECESLKKVVLPSGLKEIDMLAFSQCSSLKMIEIPATVEKIEVIAFNLMPEDFVIVGEAGSVAEQYANSENFKFQAK